MTCARRGPVGCIDPAGSARPDPRSGRRRARLSFFLPVLALALGALGLLAATPAQAQVTTVWFATLKTVRFDGNFGCATGYPEEWYHDCRNGSVLSEDEFVHDGVTYRVRLAYRGVFGKFDLAFIGLEGAEAKTALSALTLHVDGRRFAVSDAETAGQLLSWPFDPDPGWTDGRRVSLSLTVSATRPDPAPPTWRPSARTQVFWAATLTAGRDKTYFGCENEERTRDDCSSETVLTDDDFIFEGTTYTLTEILWSSGFKRLYLQFDGLAGAQAKTALGALTLNVDGRKFAVMHARPSGRLLSWPTSLSWTDGQKVSLSLGYFDRPPAPTGLSATAGNARVTLRWADPGNPAITGYQYQRKSGANAWGAWTDIAGSGASTTSLTVTGLRNGTGFQLRIRAVSALGAGQSAASARVTPHVPAPAGTAIWSATLTVVPLGGVHYGCGSSIYSPQYQCTSRLTDDDFTYGGGGTTYTLESVTSTRTDLVVGFAGLTGAAANTALGALTLNVDGRKLAIADAKTTGSGGRPVSMRWPFTPNPGWTEGQKVSLWLTGGAATPPAKPAGLTATAGNAQVTLAWTNPNDATITGYQYRYQPWDAWTDIPDSAPDGANETSYTVTGLSNGVAHAFELRAVNSRGAGPASDEATATPARPPPAPAKPAGLTATAGNAQVTLAWTNPNDATITGYQYRYQPWDAWTDIPDSAPGGAHATSYTVSRLSNEVAYRFRLRAVNAGGAGPASDEATATPVARVAPGAVWFATLKTVRFDGNFGCATGYPEEWYHDCRNGSVLSEDEFVHDGVTYRVRLAYRGVFGKFDLAFIGLEGAEAKTALSALTLHVDGRRFAVSDAETAGQLLSWPFDPDPGWTDGRRVSLSLTVSATRPDPAPPTWRPSARTQVFWAATLTAGRDKTYFGCENEERTRDDCSSETVLTDDDFIFEGTTYTLTEILWSSGFKRLYLQFDGLAGAQAKTALGALTLNVDGRKFAVMHARPSGRLLSWPTSLSWTDGQKVSLSLGYFDRPPAPTGLSATAGNARVTLRWADPGNPAITGYQYQRKSGANAWGAWTDIAGSGASTTSLTVTGLRNGTGFQLRIRAVSALGAGQSAASARVTPHVPAPAGTAIWSATLTVVPLGGVHYGCGSSIYSPQYQCTSRLTDDDFTYGGGGTTYTLESVTSTRTDLVVGFAGLTGAAANTALGALTLNVDGRKLAIADAKTTGSGGRPVSMRWPFTPNPYWTEGQKVSLWLTGGATTTMAPPAGGPGLEWARVTGAELALRFDKGLDESSVPSASAFAVSVAGSARSVSSVTVRQDLVTLTLASAVSAGETVTVGYTPPSSGKLRRSGGGPEVAAFSGQAVTNDTPSGQRQERGPPGTAEPLTARVAQAPPEHRGKGAFKLQVAFSAPVAGRAKDAGATVRVAGGTLARAARVSGRKDLWALTVSPSGHGAVTVTLPATADCAAAGAVCTADGRRLETALTHTVPGPVTVSVADARAKEGEDATMDFAVTLSRAASGKVTVRYATKNGTAKKGKDYRKARGKLVFAAGETAKTVSVALLDDAVDEGEETFTLRLSKPKGAVIADGEATGTIENDDPMPGAWLARFGRTVADQAVAAVRDRLGADRRPGFRGRIAGEALPDGSGTETAAGGGTGDGPLAVPELAEDERRAFMALLALKTGEGLEPDAGESRAVTGEEALAGTAFEFVREAGDGLSLGLWGRVARSGFSGRAGELSLDGDVATALLGTDWRRRDALFGLMLFRSRGEGGWRAPEGSGTVEASLSGLVPWAGLRRDGSPALWAAAGTGRGELTLTPEGGEPAAAGLRWSMAAAGAAGAPATVDALGGARVGWRADAMAARTTSEAAAGLAASATETTRLRLGLEAAWAGTLSPRLEIGLRHDGGDAETGFGLEAGGGVRFEDPARGLSASLDGRALALHEDGDLEDWGVSVSLEWDPRPETRLGPSVVATRGWGGAASGGVDALLGPETVPGLAAADGGAWSLEAAYGLRRGNGMAGVPHLRMGGTEGLEELRLGYRIAPDADRAADASAEIWAEPGVGGTGPRAGAGLEWRW